MTFLEKQRAYLGYSDVQVLDLGEHRKVVSN